MIRTWDDRERAAEAARTGRWLMVPVEEDGSVRLGKVLYRMRRDLLEMRERGLWCSVEETRDTDAAWYAVRVLVSAAGEGGGG